MLQSVGSRRGPQGPPPEVLLRVPPPSVPVSHPAPQLFYTLSWSCCHRFNLPQKDCVGPGIPSRQLQVSVTFYKTNRKLNETCFPWNTVNWLWYSLLSLLHLNSLWSSLLFGLGFMADISTLSFSKPWHTLIPFPVHWKFGGTPGVIKMDANKLNLSQIVL